MAAPPPQRARCYLVVKAQEWMCALSLDEVEETLRPLPLAPVSAGPAFVRGVSLVRGTPTPVVSLAMLLGGTQASPGRRFVSLRVPEGRMALEVDEVRGVHWLEEGALEAVPPLLRATAGGHVQRLGAYDGRLLAVLGSAHLVPEDVWGRLEPTAGAADTVQGGA